MGRTLKKKQKIEVKWWVSSLKNNRICFQTLFICFLFFQRRKKRRGKIWFINLLQKLMALQNDVNQKVRERDRLLCKGLEPRLGGGQKYCQNRSKSSNKRKCHEGWCLKTLRVVVVLRINNVGEYFEGPKRCQIAMDCRSRLEKPTFQSGRRKPSSPSYGSGLKEIWLNPGTS